MRADFINFNCEYCVLNYDSKCNIYLLFIFRTSKLKLYFLVRIRKFFKFICHADAETACRRQNYFYKKAFQ